MATKRQREHREQRQSTAMAWADDAGSSGPLYLKPPKGVEFYSIQKGTHVLDLIPYITKNNPYADEGFPHFARHFDVYKIPRGDNKFDRFIKPSVFGLKDPIADRRNNGLMSKEEADALRPQRRVVFLVNDKPGDVKNPLKVLDAVFFNRELGFGQQLVTAMQAMRSRYGEEFDPSDLKKGMTVQYVSEDDKFKSIKRIDFLPRDYEYPESVLENAPCLDDMLVPPDVATIERLISGEATVEPKVHPNGQASKRRPVREDDEDDEEDDLEDEDEDDLEDKDEDEDFEDEDPVPTPKKAPPPDDDEDEDDPWGDDEEDEEPAPPPKPPKKKGKK